MSGTMPQARRDDATAPWYDALHEDTLLLLRCPSGHLSRADVLTCDLCRSAALEWAPASGVGTIVSTAVDHPVGVLVVVVELEEGPWLVTRLESGRANRGDLVDVVVRHPEDGEPYPVVRLRQAH